MMTQALTKIIQGFTTQLYDRKQIDSTKTILIVGSPRSGTTWLMNILSTIPGYTYLFEPLNPLWFPEAFKVGFQSRTYLTADVMWPEGQQYLERIFRGEHARLPIKDSPLSDVLHGFSASTFFSFLLDDKLIVKSVNMNRMLPWVTQHFHLRGIVCIVRHPCAVIASQLKTGLCGYRTLIPPYIDVVPTKDIVIGELNKIDGLSKNAINMAQNISTPEEILATVWCLDNYVLLARSQVNPRNLVMYEHLIQDKDELEMLFSSLGEKKVPRTAYHQYKKPSAVTTKIGKQNLRRTKCHLSYWKQALSEHQIERILKIVSAFDIHLYSQDIEPHTEELGR